MIAVADKFETLDLDNAGYWSDGRAFWMVNNRKRWIDCNQGQFETYLKTQGLVSYVDKDAGDQVSEVDKVVLETLIERRVDYVGPLAGWRAGLHEWNGCRLLITTELPLIKPVEGEWPTLSRFIDNLFYAPEDNVDQRPYILGWLKHTLEGLYSGRPSQGLAVVLAGDAGCGKTLFKEFIRMMFGGKESYPYAFMTGRDSFNRGLIESVLWTIDDERSTTHTLDRLKFGDEIKKLVANSAMFVRGMHKEGLTLNPLRRLVICVNAEPEKLMILPPLDDDINDKISIFKCYSKPFPMPMDTEEEKRAFFQRVESEIPAFIRYLLYDHVIPDDLGGRFCVANYIHPEIEDELTDISPEAQLLDFIDREIFGSSMMEWTGTAKDLHRALTSDDTGLSRSELNSIPKPAWIGKRLSKLRRKHSKRFSVVHKERGNEWTIVPPERDQADCSDEEIV